MNPDDILTLLTICEKVRGLPKLAPLHDYYMKRLEEMARNVPEKDDE
jgi:hypothetical protein